MAKISELVHGIKLEKNCIYDYQRQCDMDVIAKLTKIIRFVVKICLNNIPFV